MGGLPSVILRPTNGRSTSPLCKGIRFTKIFWLCRCENNKGLHARVELKLGAVVSPLDTL